LPSTVTAITPREVHLTGPDGALRLPNDAVVVQIGGTSPGDLLATFGIATIEKRGEA
jgi:hypothetical protein